MERSAARFETQELISIPISGPGSEPRTLDETVEAILEEAQRIGELSKEEAERVREILAA